MFSSPVFTVSWRNNVLETRTLENHNTLSGFYKITFSMFTKLVSDIKYKIMKKTTRSSTLSLTVFMGNNPPRLLKCLLEILSAVIFSKHLLDPVKKKNGREQTTWEFSIALKYISISADLYLFTCGQWMHICIYVHILTCPYVPTIYICTCVHIHVYISAHVFT